MDILLGILTGLLGLVLCFAGYQFARFLIPLWGLFAGFTVGASAVASITNEGFVGTTLGIIAGVVTGLLFAVFAYFFFALAVVLLGASVGYWLGVGFMGIFGLEDGFVAAVLGLVLGALFAVIAIIFNWPKYFLIIITALGGAVAIVGGILLVINQLDPSVFSLRTVGVAVTNSWFWSILVVALSAIGIASQAVTSRQLELQTWGYGQPSTKTTTVIDDTDENA